MLVKIKFIKTGCCSAIGNFAPDDFATLGEDMAAHLVKDAQVAEYVVVQPEPAEKTELPAQAVKKKHKS